MLTQEINNSDRVGAANANKESANISIGSPLVRNLTLESLTRQLLSMEAAVNVTSGASTHSNYDAMANFDIVIGAITKTPLSKDAGTSVPQLWKALDMLYDCEARNAVSIRAQRQRIMFLHFCAWDWLEVKVYDACEAYLHDDTQRDNWISQLAKTVDTLYTTGTKSAVINPTKYIVSQHAQPYSYKAYRIPSIDIHVRFEFVQQTVMSIVRRWLSFPDRQTSMPTYWLLDIVIRNLTPAGLLLDEVWLAFRFVRSQVFDPPLRRPLKKEDFEFLDKAFQNHPITCRGSDEADALLGLQTIVQKFLTSRSQVPLEATYAYQPSSRRSTRTRAVDPLAIPTQLTVPRTGKPEHMLGFLRALKGLIKLDLLSGEICADTKLTAFVTKDTDKYLPFREYGRSRIRIKQDGGPFTPEANIRTESGLFSNLVFRGITFHSNFLLDGGQRTLFANYAEWTDTVNATKATLLTQTSWLDATELEKHFCLTTAYGQPTKRSTAYAEAYAQTACDKSRNTWLLGSNPTSYKALWKEICAVKKSPDTTPAAYPQMGTLIGHLFVADYVYAGVIPMPSADEMADIIWEINKGGARGLEELGLIPKADRGAKRDKQEVRDALRALFQFLQENLDLEEQTQMIFDIIMLEHALCKYVRCVQKHLTW